MYPANHIAIQLIEKEIETLQARLTIYKSYLLRSPLMKRVDVEQRLEVFTKPLKAKVDNLNNSLRELRKSSDYMVRGEEKRTIMHV